MPHSPEQEEFAKKLRAHPGELPTMNAGMLRRFLQEAPAFHNCHYLFWTIAGQRFMIAFRTDRKPYNEEIFPIMECLFTDGKIHEVGGTAFSREFSQNSYSEKMGVDVIADAMAETAEHDANADAFDFERTGTGKRMQRAAQRKNGTN